MRASPLSRLGLLAFGAFLAWSGAASAQQTLAMVKARGALQCGVGSLSSGFSVQDAQGKWVGFSVEYCRAVAAAIFGSPDKVSIRGLESKDRFVALQSNEVDMVVASATWTMSRDVALGMDFPAVNFYDGQGFMVRKSLGIASAAGLGGATICVTQGTTTELNLADFFRTKKLAYSLVTFSATDEVNKAFEAKRCDAVTNDISGLYGAKLRFADPDSYAILPDVISKEPLGPVVKQGDVPWADLVRWVHFALINAEELGVTQANVDEMLKSSNPEIRRLLGVEGNFGETLGLTKDWAYKLIKAMGNYGEIYDRTLGEASLMKIARGQNALWTKGGLQYGPPIR